MYPMPCTVHNDSIFCEKKRRERSGNFSKGILEDVKDILDRENSPGKCMKAWTSCCIQKPVGLIVGCMVGPCLAPGVNTDKEAEPDFEGFYLLCCGTWTSSFY